MNPDPTHVTKVLADLVPTIPDTGPTPGQQRLLRLLLSYGTATPEDEARMRALLTEDVTPTSTTNRKDN